MSANTSEALLPCPAGHVAKLCSSHRREGQLRGTEDYQRGWCYVECMHKNEDGRCGWHMGGYPTAEQAIAMWNTRAQSAELASLRARLQTAETWRDLHETSAKVERAATDDLLHEVEWMRRNAPLAYSQYRVITAERAKEGETRK